MMPGRFFLFVLLMLSLSLATPALAQDTDGDGLSDFEEINIYNTDPQDADTDNDGLDDFLEVNTQTSALDADTDDDGLSDGAEDVNRNGSVDGGETSPLFWDYDGDGLGDGMELGVTFGVPNGVSNGGLPYLGTAGAFQPDSDPASTTDPRSPDTDFDGLTDGIEDANRDGRVDPGETDPANPDTDSDGLTDGLELNLGTMALAVDSDGDGIDDFVETDGGAPVDTDGDGLIDALDLDSDNDGYADADPLEGVADDDGDGVPNYRDPDTPGVDTDGDGLDDPTEALLGTSPLLADTDADGLDDFLETDGGQLIDTDSDGTIDALDTDSDDDSVPDQVEGAGDTDGDSLADYRDPDDDGDGLPTLAEGTGDPDGDTIPNYLDLDSDGDGYGDSEEAAVGSDPYDAASTPANYFDPTLLSIQDVGNDQGRRVRLTWLPSNQDVGGSATPILSYSIYRRVDAAKAASSAALTTHAKAAGQWDFVVNLPASGDSEYLTLAETLCDSTDSGICWSVFFVRAHTAAPTVFFDSAPDSGYSVDNLAPGAPAGFVVAYGAENSLAWEPSADTDFRYFKVYRGLSAGFVPGPDDLVYTGAATTWIDVAGTYADHYLISAVDFAGNEGLYSAPVGVSGVEDVPRTGNGLYQNTPNPFNPSTVIRYSVARSEAVTLAVHDVSGRLIKTLVAGEIRPAGAYEVVWDGRDGAGQLVASGVYFYTVRTESFAESRRMTLLK